jgi:cytoskeletal protein RodZ
MAEMDHDLGMRATVGERLRHAREARGLTLEDVATQTRVPIRHLRAIEDSNFDELPAVTYTVGFGRSYANAVGLDGAEIGRELRAQLGDGVRGPTVSPAVYAPPDPARVPSRSLAWVAGLLLIVLVAGYLYWRSSLDDTDDLAQPATAPTEQQAEPQPATQPQPAAPANVQGQPVTLVATQDVWMHINDAANNKRLYYGTLKAGERFQVPTDAARPVLVLTTNPQNLRATIGEQDRGPIAPARRRMTNQSLLAADLATSLQPGQPGAAPAPAPR